MTIDNGVEEHYSRILSGSIRGYNSAKKRGDRKMMDEYLHTALYAAKRLTIEVVSNPQFLLTDKETGEIK